MAGLLAELGSRLPQRPDARGSLVVQALVAARRDADVATLMRTHLDERVRWLADLVRVAQADGELADDLTAETVAQFSMLLALGTALAPSELLPVDADDWSALIHRLVEALAPTSQTAPTLESRMQ
jgi:hypothetical protein